MYKFSLQKRGQAKPDTLTACYAHAQLNHTTVLSTVYWYLGFKLECSFRNNYIQPLPTPNLNLSPLALLFNIFLESLSQATCWAAY